MLNHVHRSKQSQEVPKKCVGENKKSVFSLFNIDDDDEDDEDWKAFRERQKMREMKRQNHGLYAESVWYISSIKCAEIRLQPRHL
jgi:hypothetical protein